MEKNKIYLGDCRELIKEMDLKPNLIIMSPPDINETHFKDINGYSYFLFYIYNKCMEKLDENGVLISITTDTKRNGIYLKHIDIINCLKEYNLFNYKIWAKSLKANLYILNFAHMLFFKKNNAKITNNKVKDFYSDVFLMESDKVEGYKNKDSFPTRLIEILVSNFTNEGDLIFDPFIGSGKSALVAKNLNRDYIGFEIEEKNCKIAKNLLGV